MAAAKIRPSPDFLGSAFHERGTSARCWLGPGPPKDRIDDKSLSGYCEKVKNITVSVDDETYRRARVKAAEQATSVSALVKRFLTELAAGESDIERLKREERDLRARITAFSAGDRWSREDVHRRDA